MAKPEGIPVRILKVMIVLLTTCALALADPAIGSAATRVERATNGCSAATPYRLTMYTNGQPEPDLYLCTDYFRTRSLVVNESRTHVWFLASHPDQRYWLADWTQPLRIQLFRTAMTQHYASMGMRPYLTFEPGTRVILPYAPNTVWLRSAPEQQAAWQTVGMAVNSANTLLRGAAPSILGFGSPTRKAVVKCAVSAYKSAALFSEATPAYDLATALGLGGNAAACARALDRAANSSSSELALGSEDLARTAFARRWLRNNRSSLLWSMAEQMARRAR